MLHPRNDRPHFFKYMSAGTARAVLQNVRLRWSTGAALNDPFDLNFDLSANLDHARNRPVALEKMWNSIHGVEPLRPTANRLGRMIHDVRERFPRLTREEFERQFGPSVDQGYQNFVAGWPAIRDQLRRSAAITKILSLTELPDHGAMWVHYADRFRGVVLRFGSTPGIDSPWPAARAVTYVEEAPAIIDSEVWTDFMAGLVSLDAETIMSRMIFTKHSHWASEREWRIASGSGRDPDAAFEDVPFHPRELSALIVGPRTAELERDELAAAARRLNPHVEVLEAVQEAGAFGLSIRPL